MTFQQLQYLLEVYHAGSVSQAAKNLYVSQPSVSISLNALEDELGFSIFTRNQKGLVPTPEGKRALEYAKRICSAHAHLTDIQKSARPVFRCAGSCHQPFNLAYVRLVEECKGKDLRFSVSSLSPSTIIQKLAACELDVAVIRTLSSWAQEIQTQLNNNNLNHQVLASIPISIRLGRAHPLSKKQDITPADLRGLMLIEGPSQEISNSVYKGILPINPEDVIISNTNQISNELMSRGLGYTVGIPLSEARCQKYNIRNIPLAGYSYKVIVVTNPAQPEKPETRRFIELFKEELVGFTTVD